MIYQPSAIEPTDLILQTEAIMLYQAHTAIALEIISYENALGERAPFRPEPLREVTCAPGQTLCVAFVEGKRRYPKGTPVTPETGEMRLRDRGREGKAGSGGEKGGGRT